ncbi:BQ2448_7892 [Microbotryum intermedium]|uniref:HECT-type E3 ubiquitin transferase n=1 Tax=Microbotryum intermedium TaxID=269621 RepID=A0A238FSC4_9BASI|nr:BQ2448_7892 [Microbotryum intermedium]
MADKFLTVTGLNANTETRSTTATATTSQASTVDGPSAKALGKRRAVSPPLAVEATAKLGPAATVKTRGHSSKRRKVTRHSSPTSKDPQQGTNTKVTSKEGPQAKSDQKSLRRSRRSLTNHKEAEASTEEMPRKGSRASRAAKAKARAAENEDDDLLAKDEAEMAIDYDEAEEKRDERIAGSSTSPSSSTRRKKEAMLASTSVGSSSSKRWGGPQVARKPSQTGKSTSKADISPKTPVKDLEKGSMSAQEPHITVDPVGPLDDDLHGQGVDEDDDEGDDDEDDGDEDGDDQYDDDPDEVEDDDFEATLGADGTVFDEESYSSGGGEPDLHDPPQTFDADGSPLDEAGTALDRGAAEAAAATTDAVFFGGMGGAFRAQMAEASARMKRLLGSLKSKNGDADAKIMALQELAELLSISTEDTLAGGYFHTEQFVKELVSILCGDSNGGRSSSSGLGAGGMTMEEMIAFGIDPSASMGGGGGGGGDDTTENDVQMMLLACRCLANLMEALPGSSHSVVYAGAVPVLCSKLQEIQFIELAEQTLSTLEKISEEMPSSIVREGGLAALLNFLDFFSFHVQRTAVTAAANCCRSVSLESFSMVKDAMPIFKQTLGYPDQRLVEQSCLAVVRIVESYRYYPEKLEELLSADLLSAVRVLLNPDCTTVGAGTYTQTLKMLATAAKASPGVAATLIYLNIGQTIYHLLTGVAAPDFPNDEGVQILSKAKMGEDDMLVMQNLVQRPKEQIQETLTLVCELLPPLPKDGIFDPKAYTHKTFTRSKAKPRYTLKRAASSTSLIDVKMEAVDDVTAMSSATATAASSSPSSLRPSTSASKLSSKPVSKDANTEQRLESIEDPTRQLVLRRFYALLLPILVDVCAASVNPQVRTKAVLGLCKIINFCDTENLTEILHTVSMASFLAAILSSPDQTPLRLLALQLVELLLVKMPDAYQYFFRREGVMHELEQIAASPILVPSKSKHASPARTPKEEPGASLSTSSSNAPSGLSRTLAQHASSSASSTTTGTPPNSLLSTAEMQSHDLITYRARHLRNEYGSTESESAVRAQKALEDLRSLVKELDAFTTSSSSSLSPSRASPKSVSKQEGEISRVLSRVASHFADDLTALSSFELQESGLVEGLLRFTTAETGLIDKRRRHELFINAFVRSDVETPAFALLVKRLQESLSRMEEFEVLLASSNATDAESRRNGPAMLARQLKLRLVAEDGSDVPRSCSNIVVSIHAIATFQAFNDYLRPRIVAATTLSDRLGLTSASSSAPASGTGGGNGANRLSGFLAAFAAANGISPPPSPVPAASSSQSTSAMLSGSANRLSSSLGNNASASTSTNPLASSSKAAATPKTRKSNTTVPPAERRRSRRLSGKGVDTSETGPGSTDDQEMRDASKEDDLCMDDPPDKPVHGAEEHVKEEDHYDEDDDEEDDHDDDEQGAFPDELDPVVAPRDERPVNLEVADDGSKVIAKTPDGTRVGTPTLGNSASTTRATPTTSQTPKPRASYAAAVKSEPTDFHLAFSVGGREVGHDTTVFGAIHALEANPGASSEVPRNLWHAIHEVRFRRVAGPPRPEAAMRSLAQQSFTHDSILTDMPASIPSQSRQAKILQLLWVLHQLNSDCSETVGDGRSALPEAAFVNNKLTAKLNRQLEEPMIVASACLPAWATDLPQAFPFLFPFDTRFVFLQSTAFGYARLVQKWVVQARSDSSRRDENLGLLARVNRQKVRIARDRVLESTHKVFELYGSSRAALEVEFFDEVGSGLGPTLEFYALASKEFSRKNLRLWRDNDGHDDASSTYVHSPTGLFPRPIMNSTSDSSSKILKHFRVLGQFVAKAMMDSRIIDVHFSRSFMKLVLDQELPLAIASVRSIDRGLAKSLSFLQDFVDARRAILDDDTKSEVEQQSAIEAITVHGSSIADLALDFTLPGYDIALKPEGDSISVTADNIEEYISLVLEWTLRRGVASQVSEFKNGFSAVFPVRDMQSFTPSELVMMTSALQEDWSIEGLTSATKADHGFTMDSRPVRDLLSIMSELSLEDRRVFLSFITGSPRLPIGGFAALSPTLTIVRKDGGDGSLPSVMTCVNYFKLPDYTSRKIVKERIMTAIREGGGGFHLS